MSQLDGARILGHRGDDEPLVERLSDGSLSILSDVEIFGLGAPHRQLKTADGADANAHRLETIQAISDGKRLELTVKRALAYRQVKGKRNRRGLRFATSMLETAAPSWRNTPFLFDHNTSEQISRKGTILSSDLGVDSKGVPAFYMGFSLVTPDSQIALLNGTLDRFSIGWFSTGPVLCTVHGCDVTSAESCYCWPLDAIQVDGKTEIAEYEYQSIEGKELSAVNVPAVKGTKIEEFRAALSAELHLPPRQTTPKKLKERAMLFTRLAAALGVAALTAETDEPAALLAAEELRRRAISAETDAGILRAEVARLTGELVTQTALANAASSAAMDQLIVDAYKAGKLTYGKDTAGASTPDALESLLRDFGKSAGREALSAKITAMRAAIPIGVPPIATRTTEQAKTGLTSFPTDADIDSLAAQLKISVNDIRARYGMPLLAAGGAQ